MGPKEEFGEHFEEMLNPFRVALLDLANALKDDPEMPQQDEKFEVFRAAADQAVITVIGEDNKHLLYELIVNIKKDNPKLANQIDHIVRYIPV